MYIQGEKASQLPMYVTGHPWRGKTKKGQVAQSNEAEGRDEQAYLRMVHRCGGAGTQVA